ncbi:hypothetical protein Vadar_019976 [Vaccinium darrowii]|uniref:Uncharacterized protein n=1 Tax=Vaccinium darrowii TaxID=229202 RepID=A0ACB7X2B2_9ERIC|nr:hypothetical protein Vadar_019976 [Vaccinium darrowii]
MLFLEYFVEKIWLVDYHQQRLSNYNHVLSPILSKRNMTSRYTDIIAAAPLVLVSFVFHEEGGNWGSNPFVLWNPSTRSHKRILCPYELPYYSLYGLCYDSAVDDYRVFIVSRRNETSVVVYSSRNDSWNIFIDNRYVLSSSKQPAVHADFICGDSSFSPIQDDVDLTSSTAASTLQLIQPHLLLPRRQPLTQPPTRLITLAHHRQPKPHQQGQRQFAKSGVN